MHITCLLMISSDAWWIGGGALFIGVAGLYLNWATGHAAIDRAAAKFGGVVEEKFSSIWE
jgi:hypothetical protein